VATALPGGLGYTFDGMDAALVAFILPSATAVFSLSSSQTGLLGSSVLIGYLFGALSAGVLGDLIGRKRVMMYALAIYAVASFVAALSPSWGFLFWSRVVAGFGTGAESAIIALFLAEFVAGRYRGRFIGSLAGFFSFGFVLAALLGYFIVPNVDAGWRWVQIISALPIVMILWWRRSLPESPAGSSSKAAPRRPRGWRATSRRRSPAAGPPFPRSRRRKSPRPAPPRLALSSPTSRPCGGAPSPV
jgi:MFS transporter, putative metabolite:H+ symporter